MPITADHVESKIKQRLQASLVQAEDLSDGCGSKFSVLVVHDKFQGMTLLDRQRTVHECLKEEMTQIHALQMKTWTPQQYAQKMNQTIPTEQQTAGEH